MTARAELTEVDIHPDELKRSFCHSKNALGNTYNSDMTDILYVKPDTFDPSKTRIIADEISKFNSELVQASTKYLLIGPGRWGSADHWLGIPVEWSAISGVGAIVETMLPELKVEPSQGSHFFQNITSLGIHYITVTEGSGDYFDWEWVASLLAVR